MTVLVDCEIEDLARTHGLLAPFFPERLSSMGYDLTLSNVFRRPVTDAEHQVIDPFNPPEFALFVPFNDFVIVPPHSFVLGTSVEVLRLPSTIIGICLGRSTYARAGVITHVTPIEPGWEGQITIEISNTNPLPVKVHVGEGITQVIFLEANMTPLKDYAAKGGRYQGQVGVTQGRKAAPGPQGQAAPLRGMS